MPVDVEALLSEARGLLSAGKRSEARRLLAEKARDMEGRGAVLAFLDEHLPFTCDLSLDGDVIACADRTLRALPSLEVLRRLPRPAHVEPARGAARTRAGRRRRER